MLSYVAFHRGSLKKSVLDNRVILKHHLLIICTKHTSAQQWCVTGYNS